MTDEELIGTLTQALKTCQAELVTLSARLPEPFKSNCDTAAKIAKEAISLVKS